MLSKWNRNTFIKSKPSQSKFYRAKHNKLTNVVVTSNTIQQLFMPWHMRNDMTKPRTDYDNMFSKSKKKNASFSLYVYVQKQTALKYDINAWQILP